MKISSNFFLFYSLLFCIVDAFLASAPGRDKEKGPDPQIGLVVHPPENVIVPVDSFAWLDCVANYSSPGYDYVNDDPMAGIDMALPSIDDYQLNDGPNDDSMASSDFSAYACKQEVQYQWFYNDKPLDMEERYIQSFCNGTIKIKYSIEAEGVYRCLAKTIHADVGAVISKASTVKMAGMSLLQYSAFESLESFQSLSNIFCFKFE